MFESLNDGQAETTGSKRRGVAALVARKANGNGNGNVTVNGNGRGLGGPAASAVATPGRNGDGQCGSDAGLAERRERLLFVVKAIAPSMVELAREAGYCEASWPARRWLTSAILDELQLHGHVTLMQDLLLAIAHVPGKLEMFHRTLRELHGAPESITALMAVLLDEHGHEVMNGRPVLSLVELESRLKVKGEQAGHIVGGTCAARLRALRSLLESGAVLWLRLEAAANSTAVYAANVVLRSPADSVRQEIILA